MSRLHKIVFLFLFFVMIVESCTDESQIFTIPYAPVSFRIDLNGLDYELKEALTFKTFTEKRLSEDKIGFSGILLVSDITASSIYAYDLCCPYEDNKSIKVDPLIGGKAKCNNCGSVFVTMYGLGTPESGPSNESLQMYNLTPLYPGVYHVSN